ncbi:unnamed protein product [Parascedosporium putredinis]|uniref:non-specific serine/threonine protein kinase n=1 Tax=Parascedosporium putredinis TaxID=1442378 RepID=A0A9P1H6L1_9PEZI|nr:unnamed protein product [Parascedosporium putredinis]CAI7997772.1 unnamed protein product [Parascedosporium putredinis]
MQRCTTVGLSGPGEHCGVDPPSDEEESIFENNSSSRREDLGSDHSFLTTYLARSTSGLGKVLDYLCGIFLGAQGPDFSVTRQKAIEDAKMMQSTVNEQCASAGQEVPPYILSELIGKGSFGRVYKATATENSQLVAVKIIDIEESDTINPKLADTYGEFLKEVNALKLLSNSGARNINHVLDALPVGQSMWMITEYCAGGSVATLMKPTAPGGLQERWVIPILREVAEAIFWVHKQGIIHRDIKCANILVHEAGGVQLCDFGVAGVIETKFDKRSTFIGTLHWMAPELFAFEQTAAYGTEVDIWAFGSMVYEIASGLPPNTQLMDMVRLGNYLKQHSPRLEGDQYSDALKDLVAYCLEESPRNRPTIEQVQRHPYIFNSSSAYPTASLAMLVRAYKLWEAQGGSRKSLFAPAGRRTYLRTSYRLRSLATNVEAAKGPRPEEAPNFPVLKAPLEKVFDPNTLTGYEENSKNYYGVGPPPPPTSDLPLRDVGQGSDVRESLIDLDASLHGGELSHFVDMETIRASGAPRASLDYGYSMPEAQDLAKPPLSDPEQFNMNRRTQDWKFPTMAPPASANPEMSRFPFNTDHSAPSSAGQMGSQHYTADSSPWPRVITMSSFRLYVPFSNREPSIYVSDDSTFVNGLADLAAANASLTQRQSRRGYHSGSHSFSSSNEYSDPEVMLGEAGLEEVKDEFRRLMMSFGEHLNIANDNLAELPVRRGNRAEVVLRD